MSQHLSPEADAILGQFHIRGFRANGFIEFGDFGDAIVWKEGFVRDEPIRRALATLIGQGFVIENLSGLTLTQRGEEYIYGECQPKHGARVYRIGDKVLIKQTVLRGNPPEYVIDEHRERHVHEGDDAGIAAAIRDAVHGQL